MQQHEHIGLAAGHPRRRLARVPATLPVPAPLSGSRLDLAGLQRARIEALVDHLIALLDVIDGDDDREPCADEPLLWGVDDALGDPDDAEASEDAEEPDDAEASAQPPVTPDSTRPTRDGGLFA